MLNNCNFIGRLGKDPESKDVGGNTVVNFSIGCSEKYTNKAGEKVETTEWINCVCWGKLADVIAKYATKGMLVHVMGKFTTRNYEKDGKKVFFTEIRVTEFLMLQSKSEQSAQPETKPEQKPNYGTANDLHEDGENDLAF